MVSRCAGKFKKKEKRGKREISRSRKEFLGPFLIASGRTKSLSFANGPTRWNTGNTPARNDIVSARGRTAGYVVNGTAIRRSNSVGIGVLFPSPPPFLPPCTRWRFIVRVRRKRIYPSGISSFSSSMSPSHLSTLPSLFLVLSFSLLNFLSAKDAAAAA